MTHQTEQLQHLRSNRDPLLTAYNELKELNLSLDMTRGKPSSQQLDLSNDMLLLPGDEYRDDDGTDCRNYGGLDGLPAMKRLFAEILMVNSDQVIVGGNSSLTMMHDALVRACLYGVVDGKESWFKLSARKFLCPSPGYDRHFYISEHLGFELITVEMNAAGPDMDQVEKLVQNDDTIKGIWCVPRHSNPTGATYSNETVRRLAAMNTAAHDFRIIWDNAYAEHHLVDEPMSLENIMSCCVSAGHVNRVLEFASTSKISLAGAGIAAMAASDDNIKDARRHIAAQSIGPDKLNQLRHLIKFPNLTRLREHMQAHKNLIKPKFDMVDQILTEQLGQTGIATWTKPEGGYFISLDLAAGCATRVVELAAQTGVKLTAAGATFPYGKDPFDRNIRIAPTLPPLSDIRQASIVLASCVKLASSEQQP